MASSHRVTDLQHTDTSKHTKAALKCHVLHSDIGTMRGGAGGAVVQSTHTAQKQPYPTQ